MRYLKLLKELVKKKNLKIIAPALTGLIIAIAGIFGATDLNPENLEGFILVFGGLVATVIGIFSNPDKNDESGNKNDNEGK